MMKKICSLDAIPASGCIEFELGINGRDISCFLVYREGIATAYRNRCPHTGAPLNWNPNVFLNPEGTHIQCDLHGAQFRVEDGHCLYGPCAEDNLEAVTVVIREGEIWACEKTCPRGDEMVGCPREINQEQV